MVVLLNFNVVNASCNCFSACLVCFIEEVVSRYFDAQVTESAEAVSPLKSINSCYVELSVCKLVSIKNIVYSFYKQEIVSSDQSFTCFGASLVKSAARVLSSCVARHAAFKDGHLDTLPTSPSLPDIIRY